MRIPTNNLSLMIGSVCLAALLWFWVGAEERSEIVLSVPLEYRNLRRGNEIVSDGQLLTSVNVWVRGTSATIKNLRPDQVSAWVDLASAKPGIKHFELDTEDVAVPYGFSVLRISPSRVSLSIEQISRHSVPVVARLDGNPADGYEVTNVAVTPPHVEIIGPHSALNLITQVTTDSINIAGLSGNLSEDVNVGLEHSAVRL
ncbi:MAG TPA: CdaR family protein, partial [Acidobacteriota bacterium]